MQFTRLDNNDDKIRGPMHNTSALKCLYFKFCFVCLAQVGESSENPHFGDATLTFRLNPLTGLYESINEKVLFS